MPEVLIPESIVDALPEWAGSDVTELSGGLTNRTFRLDKGGISAVLKIDAAPRTEPFNTRAGEAIVQNAAAAAGLAPRVLYSDECTYLTEYVDGTVWQPSCLDKPGNLELLAAILKKLHALPLSGRAFDAKVAANRYVQGLRNSDADVVRLCNEVIASLRRPQNLCCCHNDLVAENVLAADRVLLIDWEYACDNDPFFDLATIVEHHELKESQVSVLLQAYFGDSDISRWRQHLAWQQKLYLALLWLWMAQRGDTNRGELERVAERLVTSCS